MKRLLNTLFILSEDLYLSLDNQNLTAWRGMWSSGSLC